jgi:hypothetical protein
MREFPGLSRPCPTHGKGSFFGDAGSLFRHAQRDLPQGKMPHVPRLLAAIANAFSQCAGSVWEQPGRVTQTCRLERVVSRHDR